ncbi:MAG: putative caspase-like protein [Paraglaciecola sp.]
MVIGNKNYATAPLKNSSNDAIAVADSLTDMGFRFETLQDPSLKAKYDNEILTLIAEDKLNGALAQLYTFYE